jgi:predicted RNA-binding Zn-ribbon protein involved in translation (DUF1610 family)
MPYIDEDDDDGDNELEERELPDEADHNEDQETHPCPHCGEEIYDDAEQCPKCGRYIGEGSSARKPIWLLVGVIVCALIVLGWIFRGNL